MGGNGCSFGPPLGVVLVRFTQPGMFPEPEAVARRTDPQESWDAARSVRDIRRSQAEVLSILRRFGPLTDEAIAYRAHDVGIVQSPSGLRTRRRELVDLGLVLDTGRRAKTVSGRSTAIWEAVR